MAEFCKKCGNDLGVGGEWPPVYCENCQKYYPSNWEKFFNWLFKNSKK